MFNGGWAIYELFPRIFIDYIVKMEKNRLVFTLKAS